MVRSHLDLKNLKTSDIDNILFKLFEYQNQSYKHI